MRPKHRLFFFAGTRAKLVSPKIGIHCFNVKVVDNELGGTDLAQNLAQVILHLNHGIWYGMPDTRGRNFI